LAEGSGLLAESERVRCGGSEGDRLLLCGLVEAGADDSVGGSGWERGEGELWFLSGVWLREKEMAWGRWRQVRELPRGRRSWK
jgi:hypothetical protein